MQFKKHTKRKYQTGAKQLNVSFPLEGGSTPSPKNKEIPSRDNFTPNAGVKVDNTSTVIRNTSTENRLSPPTEKVTIANEFISDADKLKTDYALMYGSLENTGKSEKVRVSNEYGTEYNLPKDQNGYYKEINEKKSNDSDMALRSSAGMNSSDYVVDPVLGLVKIRNQEVDVYRPGTYQAVVETLNNETINMPSGEVNMTTRDKSLPGKVRPAIKLINKETDEYGNRRAYYNSDKKAMYVNNINDVDDELTHDLQHRTDTGVDLKRLKENQNDIVNRYMEENNVSYRKAYDKLAYNTPNTIEYHAHKEIEPIISEKIKQKQNDIITGNSYYNIYEQYPSFKKIGLQNIHNPYKHQNPKSYFKYTPTVRKTGGILKRKYQLAGDLVGANLLPTHTTIAKRIPKVSPFVQGDTWQYKQPDKTPSTYSNYQTPADNTRVTQPIIKSAAQLQKEKEEQNAQQYGTITERTATDEQRYNQNRIPRMIDKSGVGNLANNMLVASDVVGAGALLKGGLKYGAKSFLKTKPKMTPSIESVKNAKQNSFIDFKGVMQKYPKGKLTDEEIIKFKNSDYYKKAALEQEKLVKQYGNNWKMKNHLDEAIEKNNRHFINNELYGGNNWDAAKYFMAGLATTAYPAGAALYGLAASPPAIKNKVLSKTLGILPKVGSLSTNDTIIDLNKNKLDYARINENKEGRIILGGEFVESENNSVRPASTWLNSDDTFGDKKLKSKDVTHYYGVEEGKFKVGTPTEFKKETDVVPMRFGYKPISQAIDNNGKMRLIDNSGNIIYHNTPNTGKFILYSPSTKNSSYFYINNGKQGVDKVNEFIKNNKDAVYVTLDNGRYEYYGINESGLTPQDYQRYYEQDLKRSPKKVPYYDKPINPGYNIIIKKYGGKVNNNIKSNNTPTDLQIKGYKKDSPYIHLNKIKIDSDTIDTNNMAYPALLLINDKGEKRIVYNNTGNQNIPNSKYITEYPIKSQNELKYYQQQLNK